jgi:redox-sensitive bicupin YhaK (pirin superfamily)
MDIIKGSMKRRDILKFFGLISLSSITGGVYYYFSKKKGKNMNLKEIYTIVSPQEKHWVGDGFFVSTLFSPGQVDYQYTTPFILMDHAAPRDFAPTDKKLGVGEHPHRGFETVTFAIKGEIDHRDSGGGGGTITTGGVQWMTAAQGVVHEEFHSRNFAKTGGLFEMVQLWVNLPAKDKMVTPRYQSINNEDFERVQLGESTIAKIISGELSGKQGQAKTYTDINIYEIDSQKEDNFNLKFKQGTNLLILQIKGRSTINGNEISEGAMPIFKRNGEDVEIKLHNESKLLVLNGEPIDEPIVPYGPFVMNTKEEIIQAIDDFNAGKMGQLVREG